MTLLGETPYDDEIKQFAEELELPLDETRDRFILAALHYGDVRPLVCFLLMGHVPGLGVRQQIAFMMAPEQGLHEDVRKTIRYHFKLVSRSRKRGPKRNNFEIALRDRSIARKVKELMAKHGYGTYDAAVTQVADEIGLSIQTIRNAYDKSPR